MPARPSEDTPPDARAASAGAVPAGRGRHLGQLLRQSPHPVRISHGAPWWTWTRWRPRAANIASAIPVTSGGLGVVKVTLVAITDSWRRRLSQAQAAPRCRPRPAAAPGPLLIARANITRAATAFTVTRSSGWTRR